MRAGQTLTYGGSARLERRLAAIIERVGRIVDRATLQGRLRALVLFGGYGRGEGGVVVREGRQHPNNNLDFLLITRRLAGQARDELQDRLHGDTRALVERAGIGIDVSVIDQQALARAPCLVMWHDLRFGHRVVRGDPEFVSGLDHFTPERILASDMAHLVANRGTLLLLNEEWERRSYPEADVPAWIGKHASKAVLGYGDARLYSAGRYHWSYAEKLRRILDGAEPRSDFARLYRRAARFRFRPSAACPEWALSARGLLSRLEPEHRAFEAHRIGADTVDWGRDLERACQRFVTAGIGSPRVLLRRTRDLLRAPPAPRCLSATARLAWRAGGARSMLTLLFPIVAYDVEGVARDIAADALGAPDRSRDALRTAYLRRWASAGDRNFPRALRGLLTTGSPA
jgi:hypothetical protein